MQKEITEKTSLLDSDGRISNPGWARRPFWSYNRENIKASPFRLKEWDYYCILNDYTGIALTLSDMGYLGFAGITVFDFDKKTETSRSVMTPLTLGRWNLPRDSDSGVSAFENKTLKIVFSAEENKRKLDFYWKNFNEGMDLSGKIELSTPAGNDSIVVATPFKENKHAFYYNRKINCLSASGSLATGNTRSVFTPADSFGVLDWGRGVWTYSNTWYWGSASGLISGLPFGFNIGYGFGDNSTHSENAVFYNGRLHKLDRVTFDIPKDDYLAPWHFFDNQGRFDLEFSPLLDRSSRTDLLLIKSDQHQVFGRFSGKAVLDDGKELHMENLTGFAEKVYNRW